MIDVTLDVKGNGGPLKVVWRSPAADVACYEIDAQKLLRLSAEVRARLHTLIATAMQKRSAHQSLSLGLELKELAKAGHSLRKAIFRGEAGYYSEEGFEAEEWLESLEEAVIHVTIDRQIYIPWGLVYDGDPELLPDEPENISIDRFYGFWCLKYKLSTLYNRIPGGIVRKPRTTGQARIVKLVNEDAWARAFKQVSDTEQKLAAAMFTENDICSSKDFERVWKTQKKCLDTDLLYFFGHANGSSLAFRKGDLLTMDDFPEILRRRPPANRPACMVFLNGCHTAVGNDTEGGFLQATAYGGFCGFVGTESEVPDVFALRFANAFLSQLLYSGSRAIDVMHTTRRDYWPLSLAYNLSCHPDFQFDPSDVIPPAMMPLPDFSKDAIGSEKV